MEQNSSSSILIIYTGGTIGMMENPETGVLENFDWRTFKQFVPELKRFHINIDSCAFRSPIDSSDMEPQHWVEIARTIADNYDRYNGFVLLHGTDTMAYTASALSFMLEDLQKPVIITGSQLPIGQLRTDGKENLLTSIEIASAKDEDGNPMVPEVCIFFQNQLLRGNRTTKINTEGFNAFRSYNYPILAKAGIHIHYSNHLIRKVREQLPLKPHYDLDSNVVILTLFPGIRKEIVDSIFSIKGLRGVILKTFGSGNAPRSQWLLQALRRITAEGVIVVNVSQCSTGSVEMQRYETGMQLLQLGIINGYDATIEATLTKLMFLLGQNYSYDTIVRYMGESISGEITVV